MTVEISSIKVFEQSLTTCFLFEIIIINLNFSFISIKTISFLRESQRTIPTLVSADLRQVSHTITAASVQDSPIKSRQRFWLQEFVNERLRASHLPILLYVTDLPLNKGNAHVSSYKGLGYWTRRQGQWPRFLARPTVYYSINRDPNSW